MWCWLIHYVQHTKIKKDSQLTVLFHFIEHITPIKANVYAHTIIIEIPVILLPRLIHQHKQVLTFIEKHSL